MCITKMIIVRTLAAAFVLTLLSTDVAAWPFKTDHGHANAVAVDADGNIIAAGSMVSLGLEVYKLSGRDGSMIWKYRYSLEGSPSAVEVDQNGDVFVASDIYGVLIKISGQTGAQLWATYAFERINALEVDAKGNIIAVGRGHGGFRAAKFDTDGNPQWIYLSPLGRKDDNSGPSFDEAYALDLDGDGNVIAAGTIDEDFVVVKITSEGGDETMRNKIDGAGTSSYFFEKATAVVVDSNGDVLVGGDTSNPGQGPSDFTVAKFSSDLSEMYWVNPVDGTASYMDHLNAMTVDSAGDVIAVGNLFNKHPDPDGGPNWSHDQFAVVKLAGTTGDVIWNEGANFADEDKRVRGIAYDVVVNRGGNVVVTGLFNDTFTTVKKYALSGKNWWRHKEMDNPIYGTGFSVALDAQNNVIVGGNTRGENTNIFAVLKLERLSGVTYIGAPDLVKTLAPVVYLHPDDRYRPGNPDTFINNSSLKWSHAGDCDDHIVEELGSVRAARLGKGGEGEMRPTPYTHAPNQPLPNCLHDSRIRFKASNNTRPYGSNRDAEDDDTAYEYLWRNQYYEKEGFFLDLGGDEDEDATLREGIQSIPGSTYQGAPVFYEYVPYKYITYWFFYPYNEFSNVPVFGDRPLQSHEGDWERVSIQLDCQNEPLNIFYYNHGDGMLAHWSTIDKYQVTHPIVFSAKGSHASYPDDGEYPTDFCRELLCFEDQTDFGPEWHTWENLANVKAQLWYGYGGAWGEVGDGVPPAIEGGEYTGPSGPSKYKTSRELWEVEHPNPVCGP